MSHRETLKTNSLNWAHFSIESICLFHINRCRIDYGLSKTDDCPWRRNCPNNVSARDIDDEIGKSNIEWNQKENVKRTETKSINRNSIQIGFSSLLFFTVWLMTHSMFSSCSVFISNELEIIWWHSMSVPFVRQTFKWTTFYHVHVACNLWRNGNSNLIKKCSRNSLGRR